MTKKTWLMNLRTTTNTEVRCEFCKKKTLGKKAFFLVEDVDTDLHEMTDDAFYNYICEECFLDGKE